MTATQAARSEAERLSRDLHGETNGTGLPFTVDWNAEFADDVLGGTAFLDVDEFGEDGMLGRPSAGQQMDSEPVPIDDRAVTQFRTHQRLTGVTWSPGGAISLVQYNKRLQGMVSGKRHMEPI